MQNLTSKAKQKGQAIILALCLILIGMGATVILYNTGQAASEKARLVNAADAAAYSGAVFMARNLNFIAYTNRAMIANHVMVGHMVSYVSWVRMVDDSTEPLKPLAEVLGLIPYIGTVLKKLLKASIKFTENVVPTILDLIEGYSKLYVPFVELMNQAYYKTQQAASIYLLTSTFSYGTMNDLMNKTAKEYNKTIEIKGIDNLLNDTEDSAKSTQMVLIIAQAAADFYKVYGFIKGYSAEDDKGRIKKLTLDSLNLSKRWIKKRQPKIAPIHWATIVPLLKKGKTKLKMEGTDKGDTDWKAQDKLVWGLFGKGKATATEFLDTYTGVPGYYDIEDIKKPQDISLPITVFASMPFEQARIYRLLGMKASVKNFSTVSRAEAYFRRPDPEFKKAGKHGEFPNVFNPFWEARLIKTSIIPQL